MVKYAAVVLLYLLFAATSASAGISGLIVLPFKSSYTARVMQAMDRLMAALLGWDGHSTVSKECGRSECRFCRVLCSILNVVLEKNHCQKEAQQ